MKALLHARPGSTPWLVRHELRLAWRFAGGKKAVRSIVLLAVLSLGLHVGAWALLRLWPGDALPAAATYLLGVVAWVAILLMLAQAISASVSALFDRGDLDLLLSSPLPTRSVFMARGLGIATNVSVLYLFVLGPLADVGLFMGHANLLAIYPTVLAIALAVSAFGLALTLLLVRALGARRARTVAQVIGALVGASMFLAGQATNLLGRDVTRAAARRLVQWAEPGGPLALDSPVWWPARALQGALLPMLAIATIGGVAFWAVVQLTHRRFLAGTQESVTGSARRGQSAARAGSTRFRAGLAAIVLAKEWRMILRDPQVITQTLMQVLYLLPMVFLVARNGRSLALVVPVVVWLASTLASNIAWLTVAAEDAPELLGSAPVPLARLRALKVLAALLPVWLLVSPMIAWTAWTHPLDALVLVVCLAGGTGSVGAAQVWYPRQGKRADMKKRMQGHGLLAGLELLLAAGWVGLAYCLGAALAWTPVPLLVVAAATGAIWTLGRSSRESGA